MDNTLSQKFDEIESIIKSIVLINHLYNVARVNEQTLKNSAIYGLELLKNSHISAKYLTNIEQEIAQNQTILTQKEESIEFLNVTFMRRMEGLLHDIRTYLRDNEVNQNSKKTAIICLQKYESELMDFKNGKMLQTVLRFESEKGTVRDIYQAFYHYGKIKCTIKNLLYIVPIDNDFIKEMKERIQ